MFISAISSFSSPSKMTTRQAWAQPAFSGFPMIRQKLKSNGSNEPKAVINFSLGSREAAPFFVLKTLPSRPNETKVHLNAPLDWAFTHAKAKIKTEK